MSDRTVPPGLMAREYRATTIGFVMIVSLIAFETLAVGTAMPTIVGELKGLSLYGWAFTSLLMANVVGVALGGHLCDQVGARTGLIVGAVCFASGLGIAGLSQTMPLFLIGRAAQGLGGGAVIVSLYVLAAIVYDEHLRPKLFAIEAAAWVVPAMVGPFIAGAAVDFWTWRALFLALAPLAASALLLIWPARGRLRTTRLGSVTCSPHANGPSPCPPLSVWRRFNPLVRTWAGQRRSSHRSASPSWRSLFPDCYPRVCSPCTQAFP